jgi:hypothetical protein
MMHRKADCQVTQAADVQQYLPQLDDLAAAAAAATDAAQAAGNSSVPGNAGVGHSMEQQQHLKRQRQEFEADDASTAAEQQQQRLGQQPPQLQQGQGSLQCEQIAAAAATSQDAGDATMRSAPVSDAQGISPVEEAGADEGASSIASSDAGLASANYTGASPENTSGSSSIRGGGNKQRGQQLFDGSTVKTCLWAVQLQLLHPITRQPLDLSIEERVAAEYQRICGIESAAKEPQGRAQQQHQQQQQQQQQQGKVA